jgi:zinc/manganese transport system permease protein
VSHFLAPVFGDGFFTSSPVHIALILGALAALTAASAGIFTVLRGQAFAAESFGDISTMGSSASFLLSIAPLWGLLIVGVAGAAAMELIGVQRVRGRDLATGVVLGASLGLSALFIYLDTTKHSTTGASVTILFGSAFATPSSTIPLAFALAAVTLAIIIMLYRPLLLSSISPDLAAARGTPLRLVGGLYLIGLAVAVALAALTIGTILSTALLVGPAATALRLTRRPLRAILCAAGLGIAATWIGIVLAYDSFDWPPAGHGWPVSFFVTALILLFYVLSGLPRPGRGRPLNGSHAAVPAATDLTTSKA